MMISILIKHKRLSFIRAKSYQQDMAMAGILFFALLLIIASLGWMLRQSDSFGMESVLPGILILDFSLRFFVKSNPSVGIFPYLCLPIKKQVLITYLLISDFLNFWIYAPLMASFFLLYQCNYFKFVDDGFIIVPFFVLMLMNNYSIMITKTLLKEYSILIYPFFLAITAIIQTLILLCHPLIGSLLSLVLLSLMVLILNITLKKDLYRELNHFTC